MRILILGGTRFIGPPTVRRLHAQGHTLALFHRTRTDNADLPAEVTHILGNRREDFEAHAPAFRDFEPDVVLDMFPITEADAQAVMRLFTGYAGRVVAISSQDVYKAYGVINGTESGPPVAVPLTEDSPLRDKLYPYRGPTPRADDDPMRWADDYDKILVERAVMGDPALPGTVLRLPMIYGPGDYQHRLYPYLKRMDDGRSAILLDDLGAGWLWTRDYVENTAAAIALAATDPRAAGRVYNLGEMPALTLAEWVRAIGEAAGWTGEIVIAPNPTLPEALQSPPTLAQDLVASSERIRAELGYHEVVPQAEALRRTVAWERAHPPQPLEPQQYDYAAEDEALYRLRQA